MYVYIVWIWFLEKNYDIRNWKWGTKQLVKKEKKENNNKEEEEGKKEKGGKEIYQKSGLIVGKRSWNHILIIISFVLYTAVSRSMQ